MQKFKVGDKVMWDNDPSDYGTVTRTSSTSFDVSWVVSTESNATYYTEALWQRDTVERIKPFKDNQCSQLSEQQAVQLLLSLGYTISKQPMVTDISNKA